MSNSSPIVRPIAPSKGHDFGELLKRWRGHRRTSQLQLALASGISQRHISFLETGRAQPSRRTILDLAETLDVPLRERNAMLLRAGFSALYPDQPLAESDLGLFREALDQMLAHHEPYPAILLDGRWNLVSANAAAMRFFSLFADLSAVLAPSEHRDPSHNFPLVRLCLSDAGLRPYIENWQELMASFLHRGRTALLANPMDQELAQLVSFLESHPDAPSSWLEPSWDAVPPPAMVMRLHKDGQHYALFTMMSHFGAPQQVTAQELSVELFFPADEQTRSALVALQE